MKSGSALYHLVLLCSFCAAPLPFSHHFIKQTYTHIMFDISRLSCFVKCLRISCSYLTGCCVRRPRLTLLLCRLRRSHSVRNDFTGFATAALIALKHIVHNAIQIIVMPAITNTQALICILYAKSCSHILIAHHATGTEIMNAIATSNRNSFDTSSSIF